MSAKQPRFRWQGGSIAVITVIWLLLWAQVDLFTLVSGVLVGYVVTVAFPLPPVEFTGRLRPWELVRLVVSLFADLTVAAIKLAVAAFRRNLTHRPGVVRVDLTTSSDLIQVLTAAYVSLVPGTLVIEAPRSSRRLYLHVFDASDPRSAERERLDAQRVELKVLQAFGSDEELAAARTAHQPHTTAEEGSRP